jgi:hypothetical protein
MPDSNPNQSPDDKPQSVYANAKPRSKMRWSLIGFAIGAALPISYGMYGMHQFNVYVASLPPDTGVCGNSVLGSLALIFVIGPFCGMIGAASGWTAAAIDWWGAL